MSMRYVTATIASFIFIFIFGWAFHGVLLDDIYKSLSQLYRPQDTMQDFFIWLMLGQFMVALALVGIIGRATGSQGLKEGAKYGLLFGLLSAGSQLITYAVMPFPTELVLWWMAGSMLQMTLLGMLIGDLVQES